MRSVLAVFLVFAASCTAASEPPDDAPAINELPKYGNPNRGTVWDRSAPDERPDLIQFSRGAVDRGWQHLLVGDLATTMKRFNQAWMLHEESPTAQWGMAAVSFERARAAHDAADPERLRARLDEAVALIDEAVVLRPDAPALVTDAALFHATRGGNRKAAGLDAADEDFTQAEELLRQAQAMATPPQIHRTWAVLERYRGREAEAEKHEAGAAALEAKLAAEDHRDGGSPPAP